MPDAAAGRVCIRHAGPAIVDWLGLGLGTEGLVLWQVVAGIGSGPMPVGVAECQSEGLGSAGTRFGQPVKFLLVGAAGYGVNLAVFALLYAAGVRYVAASIGSYAVSNALMYLGNRSFTFGLGNDGFLSAYLRYVLVGGVIAGLNAITLAFLVELLGLQATLGLAISLLLVTPVAFALNTRWTFRLGGD